MSKSERMLYVLEWYSKDRWCAFEGDSFHHVHRKMREIRKKWPKDKFRVVKYVPQEPEIQ